jgi:hypothetical protein
MIADLGPIILEALGSIGAITRHRYAAGTQDQTTGLFVEGAVTNTAIDAVASPYERKSDPKRDGERPNMWIELFTIDPLIDARSGAQADEVTWNGRRFRVMECDDWTLSHGYSYSKAQLIGSD